MWSLIKMDYGFFYNIKEGILGAGLWLLFIGVCYLASNKNEIPQQAY